MLKKLGVGCLSIGIAFVGAVILLSILHSTIGWPPKVIPVADFTADPTEVVAGETVSFSDQSERATAWEWDFGDGNTSTEANPTHAYEEEGSYTVSLTVSNGEGEDTETKDDYISVDPEPAPPVADFEADTTTVEVADTIQFTDTSTNDPASWEWDFGDGTTSEEQDPTHAYAEPGDYDVTLTATNDDGSDTETKSSYITVENRRTYSVKYVADATFEECSVFYRNENGGTTRRDIVFADLDEPWTHSFEPVAREFDGFLVGFSLSCRTSDGEETAEGELIIDGEVFDDAEETGTSVSFDFDARLTLEGAEHW